MTTFVFIHPIWMTVLAVSLMGVVILTILEFSKNWELRRKDDKIFELECSRLRAEKKKQRQEILEQIGYKLFSEDEQKSNNVWYKKGWNDNASRINKELQQLNQPKTER